MDGHEDAGGGSIANAFNVEENLLARNSGGFRQGKHHVLICLMRNHQVDGINKRLAITIRSWELGKFTHHLLQISCYEGLNLWPIDGDVVVEFRVWAR